MRNSVGLVVLLAAMLLGQAGSPPAVDYHILAGNTHSHTAYTWSHGDQFTTNGCAGILTYSKDPSSVAVADNKAPGRREHTFQQLSVLRFTRCDHCGDKMWGSQLRCSGEHCFSVGQNDTDHYAYV